MSDLLIGYSFLFLPIIIIVAGCSFVRFGKELLKL
ncbi:Uncharacterized protein BCB44BAC_04634 [Bacillus cytotoxicus]|uniref:NADH dehydrogenase subunit 1 n=1 Tax=Bacillus cytotoxicus TaxID=580165 RepID=A0AAX2CNW5_9BACI|nr:Uncharacterized protein BCB44BAC_04634 [Bacillus cytotoxicus]